LVVANQTEECGLFKLLFRRSRFNSRGTGGSPGLMIFVGLLTIWFLVSPVLAFGCSFHNYKPTKTLVDWMLYSDVVALARPDPENGFKYRVVKLYHGQDADGDIPFLVDSTFRHRLANNPEDGVILAKDGVGRWVIIGYADRDHRSLIEVIVNKAANWREEAFHPDRFETFADYQDHPNLRLRRLALQEIDRVPYAMLSGMEVRFSDREILKSLGSWSEFAYRPINFLLLGLTGTPAARTLVQRQIATMANLDTSESLGAATTAYIELEGAGAVRNLATLYFSDPTQPLGKLESVVEAMAIHSGLGSQDLKTAIQEALLDFVAQRPNAAALIARQFSARQDWSIGLQLEKSLDLPGSLNPSSRLLVGVYVAQSRAALQ
jgi:hypothetical protein